MSKNLNTKIDGPDADADADVALLKDIETSIKNEDVYEYNGEDEEVILEPFELRIYPVDNSLIEYKQEWDENEFEIPKFQRNYVWGKEKASRFIESILLGLPVPDIFLYKEKGSRIKKIIDGQQRLVTIMSFMEGKYVTGRDEGKVFSLVEPSKWKGMKYEDLRNEARSNFDNYVMRATVVKPINSNDDGSSMYHIFERLNTGGMPLNPMEVRMSLGNGGFMDLLKELNNLEQWGKLLGRKSGVTKLRFKDVELILRFFALQELGEKYKSPMGKFLTRYIIKNKDQDENWLAEKKKLFESVLENISCLGEQAFYVTKESSAKPRLNLSILDSLMVAVAGGKEVNKNFIKDSYNTLLKNKEYLDIIHRGQGTAATLPVKERIEIAKKVFSNE